MSDFDEMRLVFKTDEGYLWRCPCGLGAKVAASTAGKARTGARDHINRRHPKAAPPAEAEQTRGRRARTSRPAAGGLEGAELVERILERGGLKGRVYSSREFQQLLSEGAEAGLDRLGEKLVRDYGFVDHVLVVRAPQLRPSQWLEAVELLERRGNLVIFDLLEQPSTDGLPAQQALLVGATLLPEVRCQAYAAPDRRGAYRPCPNWAEHLVVAGGMSQQRARVALCKLHLRTHGDGFDLGRRGGDDLVDFAAVPEPQPATPPVAAAGVRPAPPKAWPDLAALRRAPAAPAPSPPPSDVPSASS